MSSSFESARRIGSPLFRYLHRALASLEGTPSGRRIGKVLRAANAVAHGFRGERISLRAAALTYVTIFSLVPLLSVALGLVHLIDASSFESHLRALTFTVLAPGIREDSAAFFDAFLRAAGSTAVGSVGFGMLLVSAATLLRNLDGALNDLWNVRRRRSILKRAVLYTAILVLAPVVAALTLAGTGLARDTLVELAPIVAPLVLALGPVVLVVASLTLLYFYAPNADVRFKSACLGGLVAGLGWELARHLYAVFAAGAFRYNPVFGALGAAPLFLMWIYMSWLLILFGARFSYALDAVSFRGLAAVTRGHPRAREILAARVIQTATRALLRGENPPVRRDLAVSLRVADEFLSETLEQLAAAGLVELGWQGGVQPAGDPDALTLADISRAVGGVSAHLDEPSLREWQEEHFTELHQLFQKADARSVDLLEKISWRELAQLAIEVDATEQNPVLQAPARPGA